MQSLFTTCSGTPVYFGQLKVYIPLLGRDFTHFIPHQGVNWFVIYGVAWWV